MKVILLIDDDIATCEVCSLLLNMHGYTVTCIADDFETVFEVIDDLVPDLIIMDVFLGTYDGVEICQRIKDTHKIPVILFSTIATSRLIDLFSQSNADAYLPKPFDISEFIDTVKKHLPD